MSVPSPEEELDYKWDPFEGRAVIQPPLEEIEGCVPMHTKSENDAEVCHEDSHVAPSVTLPIE